MFNYQEMSAEQRAAFMQMTPHQRMEFKQKRGVVEPESRASHAGYFAPDAVQSRNGARIAHELAFRGDIAQGARGFVPNRFNDKSRVGETSWTLMPTSFSHTSRGEFVIPSARPVVASGQIRAQA